MNQFQNAAEELEKEYQIFLDYIETNEVMISKATGHFGKKDCFELNSRFHIVKERYKKDVYKRQHTQRPEYKAFLQAKFPFLQD